MNQPSEKEPKPTEKKPFLRAAGPNAWVLLTILLVTTLLLLNSQTRGPGTISYQFFKQQLDKEDTDNNKTNIVKLDFQGREGRGKFKDPPYAPAEMNDEGILATPEGRDGKKEKLPAEFRFLIPEWASDAELAALESELDKKIPNWTYSEPSDNSTLFMFLVSIALPVLLLVFFWVMIRRTRDQIMGGGFLSGFSKSPAKKYETQEQPVTFKDVAGLDGVKADLEEIIEFLKSPAKFQKLGGRVPKGVLLNGPPGTGKTLLARAVAGEAGVPFYSVNGSEFIQMFVGVGASRVRDLFQKAKENSPAIIFVDEIDAVGRQRGAGLGGGHDEREQTLNQILSEMDGFDPNSSVIVMAATNRPDVLDPALLRPGRFDRIVSVDRPTLKGRLEMFKVHVRDVPLSEDVDLQRLAEGSVGLTGADIRNMVNEAALWATRHDKTRVEMEDFEHARDKVLMGPKREEVLLGEEKRKTAYHEAGHALLAWLTHGTDRVHKVTVIPRGRALGVTQTLPEEDKMNITERELDDRLAFMLGGGAAEKLVYQEVSAGAENDLERATSIARRMVTKWGMSERLGPVSYKLSDDDPFLGREIHQQRQFSEHTMELIDAEVARILHAASDRAVNILTENRDKLDTLAEGLVAEEELSEKDITELIGPSVHKPKVIATEDSKDGKPEEDSVAQVGS